MIYRVIISIFLLIATFMASALSLPEHLVGIASETGKQRFVESLANSDFFITYANYESQEARSFCGVASAVIALNSLKLPAPINQKVKIYNQYTQDNVFNIFKEKAGLEKNNVLQKGMTLDQFGKLVSLNGAKAEVKHIDGKNLQQFRRDVMDTIKAKSKLMVVNYSRKKLGLPGGGHFSPIIAYHKGSDSILMLEVARYKYGPFWVKTVELFDAMNTMDVNKSRGYTIASK